MKTLAKLFLVLTMVITMLPTFVLAEAQPGVVFYNAAGAVINSLDEVSEIYAEVNFDPATSATVIGAHYNFDGKLEKTEFITPVNEVSGYTTPSFSVENTDVVKIFAWSDFVTLTPVLNPGVIYKTPELPTAAVTTLNTAEIEDVDLTFAMNFKADEVNQYQLATYGNWYADYVLTVNKTVSYNANGTADAYLAGQYDSWSKNWLAVPTSTYTVEANTPVKVMESAAAIYGKPGLKYTYKEVYESVKDFDCGVFFGDEFIAANPDLTATLELRMYNPANPAESYAIGETYTFTAMEALYGAPLPTATVTMLDTDKIADVDLTFAMNFKADAITEKQLATYGNWYADYVLTVNKTVSYNANGTADAYLAGQYDSWSKNWLAVPTSTYTVEANTPVKVMESAAAIYGKPGLKYTYKEVYESVKDFDCGVFFGDEFLAANPDLTATLELRMYNPENESESYVIGETYTFKTTGAGTEAGVDTVLTSGNVTAEISANVVLESGVENLKLTTTSLSNSESGITADENEKLTSFDVHVEGVAKNNTTPVIITIPEAADKGLNKGNLELYHVENGETVMMEEVESKDDLTKHNQFTYEPLDGTVVLSMATFSEVALVEDTTKAWEGKYDYSWYDADAENLVIANADQLAAFGKIVGGMAEGIKRDTFESQTVKLNADINLGNKLFHPVGYYFTLDNAETEVANDVYSTVYSFEGTFDGNGNTIKDFYQNTWEMKGDYNDGYPAGSNHYKDGMGLFGYVVGGTVKNLTVDNFSSDGEFTPTGVIAAYAVDSTFENIAITNCNPRVYNTGNGGIVGIGGNSDDTTNKKLQFTNITVDQSNKISALWGSYDVACGGIMGMFRGNGEVNFANCHVAAEMDVNNDVCANYQYYWYRYSGMLIGSVRKNTTDGGYTVADTTGITATGSTYTIGDWNEYWYCELVKNSLASYTHDHQFSRLTKIASLSDIQDENGNWNKEGNFVIPNADNTAAECYHIFKKSDGTLYQHFHNVADESNPNIYETFDLNGDSELNDLKEDRQCYFMPFTQVFNGYGYGVKPTYLFNGFTEVKNGTVTSYEKFKPTGVTEIAENATISVSNLFTSDLTPTEISTASVQVFVSPADENSTVSAEYKANVPDWANGTLTFAGTGKAKVTITDYFYCVPTVIEITVGSTTTSTEKFETKFTGDFLYRVGNANTVSLGSLFKAAYGAEIGTVSVTVEAVGGTAASGTYTSNATWTNGTIKFDGTGVVKVTITDDDNCIPTELLLEVVDATNTTTAANATENNVVLLNDCGLGSLTVSGDYAFYGNGFTATYTGNGQYLNNGLKLGVVTVSDNGTLDNLRIVASIYPASYLYYEEAKQGPSSVEGDKTRYHYQLSAVAASGNATISNCYIYGARNNIFINTGDVTVKDTVLECGTLANVQIQSNNSHTVTFENVTTIQHQVNATIGDTSKVMLGAGVIVGPDTNDNPTIVLNGSFKQYNWVNSDDATAVSGTARTIINTALDATQFNHTINGKTVSNLGIVYLNNHDVSVNNKTGLPYQKANVSMMNQTGQVYSLQGASAEQIYSDYENADRTTVNGLYKPQFKILSDLGGQHIAKTDDGDEFCYAEGKTINMMFLEGETKTLDLAALVNIEKYKGQDLNLEITCKDANGKSVELSNNEISLSDIMTYTVTYNVTDSLFYDKDGNVISDEFANYAWDIKVSVSLKDKATPNAYFEFDTTKQKMGYYKPSYGDVKQYLPFLAGLKIYDYVKEEKYLRFDGDANFDKVAAITITGYTSNEAYIEVKLTDGGVINTKFLARADSGGGSTYTGKIKTSNNTIYFVSDSGTSNKESTTTAAFWYVDYYKFTGNNGVAIQSAQQTFNSTGSSASTPSGTFGTTIKYTVEYDANGGNCGQPCGYATSKIATVTLPRPTYYGYVFAGWYTAASGGEKVGDIGDSYTPNANITLYAQWGKPCTVTYNANGGICDKTSEYYSGAAVTLPTPKRDGYWFVGWYDAATDGNLIGDAGMYYNPKGDIILYAHWQEAVKYTVTYNANDGSVNPGSATYEGTKLTLPTPTRTGYTFNGWYTATTGGTKIGDAGAEYIPSANITLYAQWTINSYTITVNATNATVKVNGTTVNDSGTVSIQYGTQVTVEVTYSESESQSTTIKGTDGTTYTSPFNMPAQNVTIKATSSAPSSSCITPETLITLADGSQVEVQYLTGDEELLVWNMETGSYDKANIVFVDSDDAAECDVVTLTFSDGTETELIYEHGYFDVTLGKYVYIDKNNAENYIGHSFVKQADIEAGTWDVVTLESVSAEVRETKAYSPVTFSNLCYYVDGMLSMPGGIDGLFNIFEVDTDIMAYDAEKMAQDIETYGLYTYADFEDLIPEYAYEAFNGDILKVAIGKGMLTWADIEYLANRYGPLFNK